MLKRGEKSSKGFLFQALVAVISEMGGGEKSDVVDSLLETARNMRHSGKLELYLSGQESLNDALSDVVMMDLYGSTSEQYLQGVLMFGDVDAFSHATEVPSHLYRH